MFKRDDFTPIFEKSGVGYDFNYSIQVMFLVCILFTYLSGCFSGEWHQEAVYRPDLYLPGQDVLYQREEAGDKLPSAANDGELVTRSDLGLVQVASEEECGKYLVTIIFQGQQGGNNLRFEISLHCYHYFWPNEKFLKL